MQRLTQRRKPGVPVGCCSSTTHAQKGRKPANGFTGPLPPSEPLHARLLALTVALAWAPLDSRMFICSKEVSSKLVPSYYPLACLQGGNYLTACF
jgi:hypothetical protein